jgi:N-acyl-L-homoserine lactone synthetase
MHERSGGAKAFEELIPSVDSRLFVNCPTARLAIGVLAVGNTSLPGLENEFKAYALLRGRVYLQERYTTEAFLQPDFSESDADDERSVHFGLLENAAISRPKRMIGGMRLIVKRTSEDRPLPIEHHFPEILGRTPVGPHSVEVSRLICRHENPSLQSYGMLPLFAAGLTHTNANALGPVYGVVTKRLKRVLSHIGVSAVQLGEAKYIPEINSDKLPILVDTPGLERSITNHATWADIFTKLHEALGHSFIFIDRAPARRGASGRDSQIEVDG